MKPAPKDVAQALRGGARLPAGRVGLRADVSADGESAPATEQPRRQAAIQIPKPPPPGLLTGSNTEPFSRAHHARSALTCKDRRRFRAWVPPRTLLLAGADVWMTKHGWFRNAGEYALAWPILKAIEWLPLPAARRLSAAVLRLTYYLTPHWRRVAERNLEMALPDVSGQRRGEIIQGVYDSLGRVLLSLARMPRISAVNVREWIEYDGFEHFERALQKGKGVLFMTAHLGNWELSAASHALFGHPMHVMVRTLDNPYLDRLLERYRTLCGNRTIGKQEFGRSLLRALRDNEAVGILIDQNVSGEDGLFVDFFGIPASATDGLAKIAMRTGAPVIPGFALWNSAEQRYVLKFYPVLEMVSTGDAERDLLSNTQRCQRMLEQVIREHPEQWLWIHRRWKTRPAGERPLYGGRSPGSPAGA